MLTWTCYGAWLHGDPRGSVDDEHCTPRTPFAPPQQRRRMAMRRRMRSDPITLDHAQRAIVAQAIQRHCEHRGWWLGAVNARTNHVHCVLSCPGTPPQVAAGQLKAWATRRLREQGEFAKQQRIWTREASARWLWSKEDVRYARIYVNDCQDGPHKQPAPDLPSESEPTAQAVGHARAAAAGASRRSPHPHG